MTRTGQLTESKLYFGLAADDRDLGQCYITLFREAIGRYGKIEELVIFWHFIPAIPTFQDIGVAGVYRLGENAPIN